MGNQRRPFDRAISIVAIIVLCFCLFMLVQSQTTASMSNSGLITTSAGSIEISIYTDATRTVPLNSLTWSTPKGGSDNKDIYLYNSGTQAALLDFSARNWNPSTSGTYLTLTNNYAEQLIYPSSGTMLRLTLSASVSTPDWLKGYEFIIDVVAHG